MLGEVLILGGAKVIIERVIYNVLAIVLAIYVLRKYLSKNKRMYLLVLGGEVVAITFNILNIYESVYYGNYVAEAVSAIFGIIVPGVVFIRDYFDYKKDNIIGMLGSGQPYNEKGTPSEYYKQIPMFEPKDPTDIIKWIKINEEDIFVQLKEKFKKAEQCVDKGEFKEAMEIYIGAEALFKDNPIILFNSGIVFMKNSNYEQAVIRFTRAKEILEQQETDEETSASLAFDRTKMLVQGIEKFDVYYNLALALVCLGKPELAVENFKKAGESKSNWILVYRPLAIILENLKRYEEAANMYEKLSEYEPEDFAGYGKIGTLFAFKKEYDKAISNYKKAARLDPDNPSLHYNMGILLYETDKITEAINSFRNAIEINNNDYRFHYNLALALEKADEKNIAIDEFKKAIKIKPDYTPASNNLAILLCGMGKQQEAIRICEDAIRHDNENYELYFNLAIANMEIKNLDNAKKYFNLAISKNPDLAEAYFGLAQIAVSREEYPIAEENYLKAIKCDKDYPNPYYNLARIYAFRKEYAKVIDYLTNAINLEKSYRDRAKNDGAFDFMKNMTEFKVLIEGTKNEKTQKEELK